MAWIRFRKYTYEKRLVLIEEGCGRFVLRDSHSEGDPVLATGYQEITSKLRELGATEEPVVPGSRWKGLRLPGGNWLRAKGAFDESCPNTTRHNHGGDYAAGVIVDGWTGITRLQR